METQILIECLLIGLASYRIANLLVSEDGPFGVFEKLRTLVGVYKPGKVSGLLPSIFSCIMCMSVYTTVGAYLLFLLSPQSAMVVGAMSVPLIIDKIVSTK